ncbi:two-component system, LytTR family, response regulator AgrA [Enterococcus sp. 9E7_DIV0242]|uniref:Two-component system, LytTR family, response regulator AgrA n=3 Tax=Candidatus Enterococcus clewellii TaxID=1834193 RepID=A0AAQ3XZB1_9ENTE
MNVFVLEDQLYHHNRIASLLSKLQRQMNFMFSSLNYFESTEAFLANKGLFTEYDIFILDIEILGDKKAGLKLAATIRREFKQATIIFLTAYGMLMKETFLYRIFALDFIEKNLSDELLLQRLCDCIQYVKQGQDNTNAEELFIFSNKYAQIKLPKNDILYFETLPYKHKIRLIAKNEVLDFTSSLNEIENLDSSFVRCHKAFVVNWANVVTLDKSEKLLYLSGNHSCPISRANYKKIVQMF